MRIVVGLMSLFASSLAFAHHPLNGIPMETFLHGVLSGIGHPLLGSDHLAFILLVGLVAFGLGVRDKILVPSVFVSGSVLGLMAGYLGIGGFFVEPGVMLSILLLGMCVAAGWTQQISHSVLLAVIGISGSLHGTAFSGALIGVEAANTAVLVGYLLGLAGTLAILALVAGYGFSSMGKGTYVLDDLKPKLIGAALAGVGGFIIFEELEGVALTMAGFG